MLFKHEAKETHESAEQSFVDVYRQLIKVVQLPAVISLISILLTIKVGAIIKSIVQWNRIM